MSGKTDRPIRRVCKFELRYDQVTEADLPRAFWYLGLAESRKKRTVDMVYVEDSSKERKTVKLYAAGGQSELPVGDFNVNHLGFRQNNDGTIVSLFLLAPFNKRSKVGKFAPAEAAV